MFGLDRLGDNQDPNWFFLEADRQTMPVKSNNLNRSSIFKKQLQYFESWNEGNSSNLFEQQFGIRHIRTLFVLSTGYAGNKRLKRCIEVNKHFYDGDGTGLFLSTNIESLLSAGDILTAPLSSGRGTEKTLLG
jgi:hypothetical protein